MSDILWSRATPGAGSIPPGQLQFATRVQGAASDGSQDTFAQADVPTLAGVIDGIAPKVSVSTLGGATGGSLVSYITAHTGAVLRTSLDKGNEHNVITPEDFGAVGDVLNPDGTVNASPTDDTAALLEMFANVNPRTRIVLGRVYAFSQSLIMPLVDSVSINGWNPYSCGFYYIGASTTIDLVVIGDGNREMLNWKLSDFLIDSRTTMTASCALHIKKGILFEYRRIVIQGQYTRLNGASEANASRTLWNGVHFDGFFDSSWRDCDVSAKNNGVQANGLNVPGLYGANLIIHGGKICYCTTGIHIGGGEACVVIDQIDCIANVQDGLLIDTALTPVGNAQIFIGSCAQFDSNGRDGIRVNDALTGNHYLQLDGTWSATNTGQGVNIMAWGNAASDTIQISGARITNNQGDGFRNSSTTPLITINGGQFSGNAGIGLNNLAATYQIKVLSGTSLDANSGGSYSGMFVGFPTSFTSAVSLLGGTGAATLSYGYYKFIGEEASGSRVVLNALLHVTTMGTTNGFSFTLPVPTKQDAPRRYAGIGSNASSTAATPVYVTAYGSMCYVQSMAGLNPATADGQDIWVNIEYEAP